MSGERQSEVIFFRSCALRHNSVKLPNIWLFERSTVTERDNFEKVVGITPVKLLESKIIVLNFFIFPISNGMLPEFFFDPSDKCFNSSSSRRGLISPLNSFRLTDKISQLDIIEISVDSGPVSMFLSKTLILVLVVMASGIFSVKKLLNKIRIWSLGKALLIIDI